MPEFMKFPTTLEESRALLENVDIGEEDFERLAARILHKVKDEGCVVCKDAFELDKPLIASCLSCGSSLHEECIGGFTYIWDCPVCNHHVFNPAQNNFSVSIMVRCAKCDIKTRMDYVCDHCKCCCTTPRGCCECCTECLGRCECKHCFSCDTDVHPTDKHTKYCLECEMCSDCCTCFWCICEQKYAEEYKCGCCEQCTLHCCECLPCKGCDKLFADCGEGEFCETCVLCDDCCDCFICYCNERLKREFECECCICLQCEGCDKLCRDFDEDVCGSCKRCDECCVCFTRV